MTDADYQEHDIEALQQCMEIASREPDRAEQLQSMLAEPRPWIDVARFAAYCVQNRALNLKPWQSPPCAPSGDDDAWALHQKMLAAGVSEFHPDPLAALAAAQAKKGRKTK